MNLTELSTLTEFTNQLTSQEVKRIQTLIQMPEALCVSVSDVTDFVCSLKQWTGHNPFQFYKALSSIRSDLVSLACKVPWLCVSSASECDPQQNELTIETLIDLLKTEITKGKWKLIYLTMVRSTKEEIGFEITLNKLLESDLIHKDLFQLSRILQGIQRNDLVDKLTAYIRVFVGMEEGEFEGKFKKEINTQAKELLQWHEKLKEFGQIQYGKVQQMLGSDETANLAHVYIELTILKHDETTCSEIAYLRNIANKEVESVDFTVEIKSYKPIKNETWCIIGNPGCGKTFLANRTALRFSSSELVGIKYSISIPCRNTDWHAMESIRYENGIEIENEYIRQWLCLGLEKGANWSNDLAKHLAGSDGEGLLIIIDGLDEFTRKVPFEKTFLCSLLTRRSLTRSTIILTSRPRAWTSISSANKLVVDRHYQVLGFSPENRDLYFKKVISNESKLKYCWHLMERHDEIKQLSLIPVNASLFAALIKGETYTSIRTLTKPFYELALYMIRRELSRMGLKKYSRVSSISNLHKGILACLYRIGFIAFLGVANRDLESEENVTLYLEKEEYPCQCLGLAHEHYRKESIGRIKQVWTFVNLTMQEFVSALYLEHTTWTEQCYSVRYISHSEANFSLFRMVVRFLCGLLSDKAAALLSILYRYLTPQPIQLFNIPMSYQLKYTELYHHIGWNQFTETYLHLLALLYETNSDSISLWFNNFKQYLPMPIYLYIRETVSPNEWICFTQSLKFVCRIHLIQIDTNHINPTQFNYLIQKMGICSVNSLALHFDKKDSTAVVSYTDIIRESGMESDTKISIELHSCDLTDHICFPNSLRLHSTIHSNLFSQQLINHLTAFDILFIYPPDHDRFQTNHFGTLIPALCKATQLTGLHLYDVPISLHDKIIRMFPQFLQLKEVGLDNYALLSALINLSQLTYLQISDVNSQDKSIHLHLRSVIKKNRDTLRGIKLNALHTIGFESWSLFLDYLRSCENLVQLVLGNIVLPSDDVIHWEVAMSNLRSLVESKFYNVTLYDAGVLSICQGLSYHPAIRMLSIQYCDNTSESCKALVYMINRLSKLEFLEVTDLSMPEEELIYHLRSFADTFSIDHLLL